MAESSRVSEVTINASMVSDELFDRVRQVASPIALSGLAGHLLPFVEPNFMAAMVRFMQIVTLLKNLLFDRGSIVCLFVQSNHHSRL